MFQKGGKFMKEIKTNIRRFESDNYYIDIIETEDEFEYWLHRKDYCMASFIYGMPKKQSNGNIITFDIFYNSILYDLEEDKSFYLKDMNWFESRELD